MNVLAVSKRGQKRILAGRAARAHYSISLARSAGEVTSQLRAGRPDIVLMDRGMANETGGAVLERVLAEDAQVPILIVDDIEDVKPAAVEALAGLAHRGGAETTTEREKERIGHALALHNARSGRGDARRVAEHLGLSLAELARVLGRSPQSVHKTPDAPGLQERLSVLVRVATSLSTLFGSGERGRVWLNAPHPDLDQARPIELIKKRKPEVVAELLEDALLGHPS